jgi:non-canonical purine NTP pyrophosphatase (RdgB/HAM1 family)
MKPRLIIATGNKLKYEQLALGLGEYFECVQGSVDGYEIQGHPEEILRHKLSKAYEKYQAPVLVDDTSLHFGVLGGFPGPYIRDFFRALKPWEMGERFVGSTISATCRLGLCTKEGEIIIGEGSVHGKVVAPYTKDDKGTEFDLFLLPHGMGKVMMDHTPEEKNKFSHRGNAMRDLLEKLKKIKL